MERILIFGNTHESREAAQTMRRRGKQVIRLRDDGIRARTAAAGNDVPHRAV